MKDEAVTDHDDYISPSATAAAALVRVSDFAPLEVDGRDTRTGDLVIATAPYIRICLVF